MRIDRVAFVSSLLCLWNCSGCGSEIAVTDGDASAPADGGGTDATGVDATTPTDAGGGTDATGVDAAPVDAGAPDVFDAGPACVSDAPCNTNPGAPCHVGVVACSADGGVSCVDGPPATDGTSCATALDGGAGDAGTAVCANGTCMPPIVLGGDVNLSTGVLTPGRACAAESPTFSVTGVTATTATLASAPTADCLATGDEVLLVSMQGTPTANDNVGHFDLLKIANVSGSTVTFTTAKTQTYGASAEAGADNGIGTGATDQKVALLRVPQLGELTVPGGVTVNAAAWDGLTGGIVALRAHKLVVDGTISAAGLGYRSGRWSRDDADCSDSVQTESGESFTGPAVAQTANNGGAAGGLGPASSVSYNANTPMCAGAGHATAGEAGKNPNGRTLGTAGAAYGTNDGTSLTMGSGNAGNLTCAMGFPGPALVATGPTTSGGVVMLLANDVEVGATGIISARGIDESRDTAASGGTIFIKGATVSLGTNRVSAIGATGTSTSGPFIGQTVKASDGYVIVSSANATGTTTPAAHVIP